MGIENGLRTAFIKERSSKIEGRTTRRILLRLLAFPPDRVGKIFARRPSEDRYNDPRQILQVIPPLKSALGIGAYLPIANKHPACLPYAPSIFA